MRLLTPACQVLWEPRVVRLTLQFIALELRWVHSIAKNGDTSGQWLPLPETPCEAYARIPEHVLENAFDYLELLAKCVRRVNVIRTLDKRNYCGVQISLCPLNHNAPVCYFCLYMNIHLQELSLTRRPTPWMTLLVTN